MFLLLSAISAHRSYKNWMNIFKKTILSHLGMNYYVCIHIIR